MSAFIKSFTVLATLAAAPPAFAQTPAAQDAAPSVVVSYADLDIGTPAGMQTLQNRLHGAASHLCERQGRRTLDTQAAERACLSTALASSRIGVDQALNQQATRLAMRPAVKLSAR